MLSPRVAGAPTDGRLPLVLVLGGRRSGKSRWAEDWIRSTGLAPVYVATAEAKDDEMRARIARHRERRGGDWRLVEAPVELARAVREASDAGSAVLVDCLTLWLTNLLLAERDVDEATAELRAELTARRGPVALVSNEVGSGIMPMNALARRFADAAGTLHQRLAADANEVVLVTAGLAQRLKDGKVSS